MSATLPQPVNSSERDGVLHLTLDRPAKRNALTLAMRDLLTSALSTVPVGIGAVVITGSDPAFCAGVDLAEMRELGGIRARAAAPSDAVAACTVPVIAAVNGACWTGGLEIALACDFVIASERATFGDTHVQFGLINGWGGSARLPLAVGERMAARMLLTGEPIDAATALRVGLVTEVTPHDELLERAHAVAARIAAAPAGARDVVLGLVREGSGEHLESRRAREREAVAAFTVDSAGALDRFSARVDRG